MTNKPIIENFLAFKGLPVAITIIATLIGAILFISSLGARITAIEKDHRIFADQYQRQIDDIKTSQLRVEQKVDRLNERFFTK